MGSTSTTRAQSGRPETRESRRRLPTYPVVHDEEPSSLMTMLLNMRTTSLYLQDY